jgi:hypothetical protein
MGLKTYRNECNLYTEPNSRRGNVPYFRSESVTCYSTLYNLAYVYKQSMHYKITGHACSIVG